MRVIAVDWSGAMLGAERRIWLAEASAPGRLSRLESGRSRPQLLAELLALGPAPAVIGLDFAFSFPAWFLARFGYATAPQLWEGIEGLGEGWLARCPSPFWGRTGSRRPADTSVLYRRCERAIQRWRHTAVNPKSIFQIGGAGSVGTGSIRGMPLLHAMRRAGARIWPFDPPGGWPVLVEIYPRLLTGSVHKSNPRARQAYLADHFPDLDAEHRRVAAAGEDAFDAAVSALVMVEHQADLAQLPPEPDPLLRLEGRIWYPAWRQDEL